MASELPRRPLVEILTDPDGSKHYVISRDAITAKLYGSQIDVWWNRGHKKIIGGRTYRDEVLVLRQQDPDNDKADVICLTLAQCYQLLDAVSRAIVSR